MSRFNKKIKTEKIKTFEGSKAYKLSAREELFDLVSTCMFSDSFYESKDSTLNRLKELIKLCDPQFVAKLAIYCRTKLNLRTISLILLVELAKIHSGDNIVSTAIYKTISRADELTEILAYYQSSNNRNNLPNYSKKLNKMSNQLRKGIGMAFNKFKRYNFQKYNRDNEIKFRDALFLTHPKPINEEQKELFKDIANNTLGIAETWETLLSAEGKKASPDFKKCWENFIDEPLYSCFVKI